MPRTIARQKQQQPQNKVSSTKFITTYNPKLPNINSLVKKHLPILHTDAKMKKLFPNEAISVVYKRGHNLKEILSPSLYPKINQKRASKITSCTKCDICKNYLIVSNKFVCKVTGKSYYVRGDLRDCLKMFVDIRTDFVLNASFYLN